MKIKRRISYAVMATLFVTLTNCTEQKQSGVASAPNEASEQTIFSKGELGPSSNVTGDAHNFGLISNDSVYNTLIGNVYFEAGARSNWHTRPSGQKIMI